MNCHGLESGDRVHLAVAPSRLPRRRLQWLTAVLAIGFFGPALTHAQTQPLGQVTGQVNDATDAPLAGVGITLQGMAERTGQTDANGRFIFPNLPEGDYQLFASLPGFMPAVRTFRLASGESAAISFSLIVQLLETTTVTAAKTGERDVQTTAMAVSVLSGAELERVQARTVADLAGRVPSLTFSQNSDFSQLTIRGIGSNTVFAGSDPSSAVYLDGVYLARPVMALADFLDLERVEVLRGPQGTLYGRNAVGGAMNLITKPPSNDVEFAASFGAGNLNAVRADARISGPIVPDKIVGSVAVQRDVADGFVRDLDHPNHSLGSDDLTAARAKLRIMFTPSTDLLVSADVTNQNPIPLTYAKVLAVKPGYDIDNPSDLHQVRTSTPAENHNLQGGASVRFTTELAPQTTLTSLTAYRKLNYNLINDADITELDLLWVDLSEQQHQLSEELTISQRRGSVSWVGGVFLFDEVDRQPTTVHLDSSHLTNVLDPTVSAASQAGFGQATFSLTRRLSATAGLRYTHEQKTIDNSGHLASQDVPSTFVAGSVYAYTDSLADNAWTPKAGLEFQAGGQTLIYGSAARGFKSGGFNFSSTQAGLAYAPEFAWTYEAGVKSDIAAGRVRLNAAAFRTNYTNLQVQTPIRPGVLNISNAASATIRGVELESVAPLARAWRVGGHVAWLDAIYNQYIAVATGGVTGDAAGHRLNNAPEWSGSAWLEWNGRVRDGRLSLRAGTTWQSTVFFTPFNDAIQQQGGYGLLDASAEYDLRRWCTLMIYGRNLTNRDFVTGTFGTPPPAFGGRPGYPREVAVQLGVHR